MRQALLRMHSSTIGCSLALGSRRRCCCSGLDWVRPRCSPQQLPCAAPRRGAPRYRSCRRDRHNIRADCLASIRLATDCILTSTDYMATPIRSSQGQKEAMQRIGLPDDPKHAALCQCNTGCRRCIQAGTSPSRSLLLTAAGTLRKGLTGGACSGSSMPNSLARALKAGRFSSRSAGARDRPHFGQHIESTHSFSSYPAEGKHRLGKGAGPAAALPEAGTALRPSGA